MKNSSEFIRAAQTASRERRLSIRQLSRKLGYNSDRTVGMVMKGQRKMSAEMQARLVKFLKLTPKEQLHLQAVARFERVGAAEETFEAASEAVKMKMVAAENLHPLVPAYALVILELLRLAERPLSAERIQKRLLQKVTREELERTLSGLASVGMLKAEHDGYFRALSEKEFLTTSVDVPSAAIRQIHRRQLERAIETIEEQSVADRELIAKTITVAKAKLPRLKRLIRERLEELSDEIARTEPGAESVVAQLNLQFYLQSK